jgi:septum formation protein
VTRAKLVLASASPRRQDLVHRLGVAFEVAPSDIDETPLAGEPPVAYARRLAEAKARAAAQSRADGVVLAADTIVVLDDRLLGKPADAGEAVRFLRALRGREHQVITAVAVLDVGRDRLCLGHDCTRVWVRALSDAEIAAYVASGDPMDKAGAYAIQNTAFHPVERIEGSESNVIGLPLELTRALLDAVAAG